MNTTVLTNQKLNNSGAFYVNNTDYKSNTLTCGTLFSGIGSFEQSLKNLNIDHTNEYMCEINKFSRETFLENHSVNNVYEDITKLDTKTIHFLFIGDGAMKKTIVEIAYNLKIENITLLKDSKI